MNSYPILGPWTSTGSRDAFHLLRSISGVTSPHPWNIAVADVEEPAGPEVDVQ